MKRDVKETMTATTTTTTISRGTLIRTIDARVPSGRKHWWNRPRSKTGLNSRCGGRNGVVKGNHGPAHLISGRWPTATTSSETSRWILPFTTGFFLPCSKSSVITSEWWYTFRIRVKSPQSSDWTIVYRRRLWGSSFVWFCCTLFIYIYIERGRSLIDWAWHDKSHYQEFEQAGVHRRDPNA